LSDLRVLLEMTVEVLALAVAKRGKCWILYAIVLCECVRAIISIWFTGETYWRRYGELERAV